MPKDREQGVPMYEITLTDSDAWGCADKYGIDEECSGSIYVNPLTIVSMKEIHKKWVSKEHRNPNTWVRYASPTSGPFMYTEIFLNDGRSLQTLIRIKEINSYLRYC